MKSLVIAAAFSLIASSAFAQGMACTNMVDGKKISGAALTAHLKKCCEADSKAKKYTGAAATAHNKKCMEDGAK